MQEPTVGTITEKLKEIYDDLANNVTNIYGRQDLHLLIDLVYHSPLSFYYNGKPLRKGYPEILIIGDTRTGKTQCAEALQAHYGLGCIAGGESMSYAGLVGGLQQLGKHWSCSWGKIPQNNRRLVIIDEAGGMTEKDIAAMSSVRSQGVAEITKIQSQKTEARARLIWLANPRIDMTVNQFSSGIDIVESLVPFPEDIARWDAIMIVSKDEVGFDMMANSERATVPHVYTNDLCKWLVLWAWTREAKEITITEKAEAACLHFGREMCNMYASEFTLVHPSEQRKKLMRLSVALAARLYNTPDGTRLIVTEAHVIYIFRFLCRIYNSPYFKYDVWSINQTRGMALIDPKKVEDFCIKITPAGCGKFAALKQVRCKNIEEYLGVSADEAKSKLSQLLLNNALEVSKGDYYHKSPQFQALLAKHSQMVAEPVEKEF